MFKTAKEVHVYIDGVTQTLSSNRKQSIPPPMIDMILNTAVIEYISSKFPTSYNRNDIESTLKRYTDFSVLKSSFSGIPVVDSDSLYGIVNCVKPYNAIKIQDVFCSYIRPLSSGVLTTDMKYVATIEINDDVVNDSGLTLNISIISYKGDSKTITIDLDNALSVNNTKAGVFYFYNYLVDILSNVYKLNVKYDSTSESENRLITIEPSVGDVIVSISSSSTNVICKVEHSMVVVPISKLEDIPKCPARKVSSITPCSIHGDLDAKVAMADFYRSKNLHLDPIAEIDNDSINIYYTDFIPNFFVINYIRKPKLFNIFTGQVPEINITKDFLDYAVKSMSLVVSNPNYDRIVNETIKNS